MKDKSKTSFKLITTKGKRRLAVTEKQKEEIWNNRGPYSEARMIIETRILDEKVWRVWVKVEALINPLAFKFVRKNRDTFSGDFRVKTILKWGEYNKKERGYISHVWSAPYMKGTVKAANEILHDTERAIIRMHKFVINQFDINLN